MFWLKLSFFPSDCHVRHATAIRDFWTLGFDQILRATLYGKTLSVGINWISDGSTGTFIFAEVRSSSRNLKFQQIQQTTSWRREEKRKNGRHLLALENYGNFYVISLQDTYHASLFWLFRRWLVVKNWKTSYKFYKWTMNRNEFITRTHLIEAEMKGKKWNGRARMWKNNKN